MKRVRRSGENELLLEVRDNGPGVPADERDRIFEAFVSTKEDGLGMGLSIAKTVVELHGGRIVCTDNESGGATFRVVLPRVS